MFQHPPRRRNKRPPPLAASGDEVTIELDVRVRRGAESAALAELAELGGRLIAQRQSGELRVALEGPLRPLLGMEHALAIYAVRPLPGLRVEQLDTVEAREAALELAAVAMSADRKVRFETMRVTAGPDVTGDRAAIGRLAGALARRLTLKMAAVNPDLILIIRRRDDGLELSARLPLPGRSSA